MIMVQESQKLSQGLNEQVPPGKGRAVEVAAVAKRRQFSTAYKRGIVRKAAACEAVGGIGELLRQEGLYTFVRWNTFFTNPPLCITEAEMSEAFAIIDKGLEITDRAVL